MRRSSARTGSAARRRYRGQFFVSVLNLPQVRSCSPASTSPSDGTLIEAWASMKSFCAEDGGDPHREKVMERWAQRRAHFHGEKRRNDTHSRHTLTLACSQGAGKEANSATWGI